jgi:hypothetical protein
MPRPDHSAVRHSVETLTAEIGGIVAERQRLRAEGASIEDLEANRCRLAEAQSRLSLLLIERHLRGNHAA